MQSILFVFKTETRKLLIDQTNKIDAKINFVYNLEILQSIVTRTSVTVNAHIVLMFRSL